MASALMLSMFLAAAQAPIEPSGWEKVVESAGSKDWVTSVLAFSADTWFVGGVGWLARAIPGSVERTSTGSRAVLGLSGRTADGVFALGDDELVMRFDGKRWTEEHAGSTPRPTGRGADILHSLLVDDSRLIAFGPTLVLVRANDHAWEAPGTAERKRLLELAESGPSHAVPAKCDEAGWFWLGGDKAMFDCHDGRSFVFDAGKISPKGTVPSECRKSFQRVTAGRGELFASCGQGKVWKTDGEHWTLFATLSGVKELVSISVTDSCVFVASKRTVWRRCS